MAPPRVAVKIRRTFVQVVTAEKFERPAIPRVCSPQRYHVFRWWTVLADQDDRPRFGERCQCGLLEWGA